MSTTAKTLLGTLAVVTAVIATIKIAESIYDKSHDNLDDLSEKGYSNGIITLSVISIK